MHILDYEHVTDLMRSKHWFVRQQNFFFFSQLLTTGLIGLIMKFNRLPSKCNGYARKRI